jgi:IS5 family transposase
MLRIHLLQQWYGLSDPSAEDALYEITSMRQFAGLSPSRHRMPDESTILQFRHLLERHQLAEALFAEVNAYLQDKELSRRGIERLPTPPCSHQSCVGALPTEAAGDGIFEK